MRVLCVARHPFLSEHLGRLFEAYGVVTMPCVGLRDATRLASEYDVDAVICDYDLLVAGTADDAESAEMLGDIPVIAVSLTRHPGEALLPESSHVAGFLYLPTLEPDDARRVLEAVERKHAPINPPNVFPWSTTTPVAHLS